MHVLPTQESVSEDPHLNGMYSASLVQGFQGDDPVHLGVAATCKHFVAYSLEGGPAAGGFTVKWLNATTSSYICISQKLLSDGLVLVAPLICAAPQVLIGFRLSHH